VDFQQIMQLEHFQNTLESEMFTKEEKIGAIFMLLGNEEYTPRENTYVSTSAGCISWSSNSKHHLSLVRGYVASKLK